MILIVIIVERLQWKDHSGEITVERLQWRDHRRDYRGLITEERLQWGDYSGEIKVRDYGGEIPVV